MIRNQNLKRIAEWTITTNIGQQTTDNKELIKNNKQGTKKQTKNKK